MSWEAAWEESRTPWDAGEAHPTLGSLVNTGALPSGRALVPGAGSGYDGHLLARSGWEVLSVDIAPVAVEQMMSAWDGGGAFDAVAADFFALDPDDVGRFDVIWDYTFLCAIEPEMRAPWSEVMRRLLAPGGQLVTLVFPVLPAAEHVLRRAVGPPYPLRPEGVTALLEPWADAIELAPTHHNHPGREGKEWLGRWRHTA